MVNLIYMFFMFADHLCHSDIFAVLGFIFSFEHLKSYYNSNHNTSSTSVRKIRFFNVIFYTLLNVNSRFFDDCY